MFIEFLSSLSFWTSIAGVLLAFFGAFYGYRNKSFKAFIFVCIGTFIAFVSIWSGHFSAKEIALRQSKQYKADKDSLQNIFTTQIDSLDKALSEADLFSILKIDSVNLELEKTKQSQKQSEGFFTKELERAHDRLSKSKNPIVPRSLSIKQRTKLLNALTNGSRGSIIVQCLFGNNESISFGNELVNLFKKVGWKTELLHTIFNNPPNNLLLIMNKNDSESKYFDFVFESFKAINLKIEGTKANNKIKFPIGSVVLIIGLQLKN